MRFISHQKWEKNVRDYQTYTNWHTLNPLKSCLSTAIIPDNLTL